MNYTLYLCVRIYLFFGILPLWLFFTINYIDNNISSNFKNESNFNKYLLYLKVSTIPIYNNILFICALSNIICGKKPKIK